MPVGVHEGAVYRMVAILMVELGPAVESLDSLEINAVWLPDTNNWVLDSAWTDGTPRTSRFGRIDKTLCGEDGDVAACLGPVIDRLEALHANPELVETIVADINAIDEEVSILTSRKYQWTMKKVWDKW